VVDQQGSFFVIIQFRVDFRGLSVGRGKTTDVRKGDILYINYRLVQEIIINGQAIVL
jgi:hypothetical protein